MFSNHSAPAASGRRTFWATRRRRIAILVIAVGIGVNTAVFSVINTVLLRPLIFPDQDSLVDLMNTSPRGSGGGANVQKFKIWREQTSIFSKVAGFDFGGAGLNLTGSDKPQQVQGVHSDCGPTRSGMRSRSAPRSPQG